MQMKRNFFLLCFFMACATYQAHAQVCGSEGDPLAIGYSAVMDASAADPTRSVFVNWTSDGNVVHFATVRYFPPGASTAILACFHIAPVFHSCHIPNLNPGDTYDIEVEYNRECEGGFTDDAVFTVPFTLPPSPPTSLAVTPATVSATGFTVTWLKPNGTTSYKLDVATDAGFTAIAFSNAAISGSALSQVVGGLSAGTKYFIRLRASNGGGSSVFSSTTQFTLPSAPTLNAFTGVATTSLTANWNTVTGATGYDVDLSTDATFTTGVTHFTTGNAAVSQAFSTLTSGTTYNVRVRAIGAAGNSNYATTTQITLPSAPTLNPFTNVTTTSFTVNWTVVTGATGYDVDVSTDPAFGVGVTTHFAPATGAITSQAVGGPLVAGTTYNIRVRAKDAAGNSIYSTTTQMTLPSTPTLNPVTAVTETSLTVNWNTVSGASGYDVDVSTDAGFGAGVTTHFALAPGTITSQAFAGPLAAGTTYNIRVRAKNAGGNSAYATTTQITLPSAPTLSTYTSITTTSFIVNWSAVTGATGYEVDVSTDPTFGSGVINFVVAGGGTINQAVGNLVAGTLYNVRVRAKNGAGNSAYTLSSQITLPSTPVLNSFTAVTTTGFTVNWNTVTGTTGYQIDISTDASFNSDVTTITNVAGGITVSKTIGSLSAGTNYYVRVRGVNAGGSSANSLPSTQLTLPDAPQQFLIPHETVTSASLQTRWQPVVSATEYHLELATKVEFATADLIVSYNPKIIPSSITEFVVAGLSPSTVYYLRMKTKNGTGFSSYSDIKTVQTLSPSGVDLSDVKIEAIQFPAVYEDQPTQITVNTSGGLSGLVSVEVYHRPNSSATFVKESLTPVAGQSSIAISDAWFDDFGMEFYVKVFDNAGHVKQDVNHTILQQIPEVKIPLTDFGTDLSNYRIISVPYTINKTRIADLFEPIMGAYNKAHWRLLKYKDGKYQDYADGLSVSNIEQGQGYWFISKTAVDLSFGKGITFDNSISKPFKMMLKKGWNQIGNPFPHDLSWHEIMNDNGNPAGVDNLITYNPESLSYKDDDKLKVLGGGFVFVENDKELTIRVTLSNAGGRITNQEKAEEDPASWILPLEITQDNVTVSQSGIGMHANAIEGKDPLDRVTTPRFMRYLELNSTQSGYEYDLTRSIVNHQAKYTWNYSIASDVDGPVNLKWNKELAGSVAGSLLLHDRSTNTLIDMSRSGEYSTHSSASFSIHYSNEKLQMSEQVVMGVAYPNPFDQRLIVPFDYTNFPDEKSTATLVILDMRGMEISRMEKASDPGQTLQIIEWSGQTSAGTQVPSGMYLYRLVVSKNNLLSVKNGKIIKK
jgi:hypothetical protein